MGDPNRDQRFARAWRRDYDRPRRDARQRIVPGWLAVLIAVVVILFILSLFVPGLVGL